MGLGRKPSLDQKNMVIMTEHKKQTIFLKYGGHCAYCGNLMKMKNMTVDHLKPKSKGGSNYIENLMPSCRKCNALKADDNLEMLRISLAWPTLRVSDLQNFQKVRQAAKKYKFYFEK